MRAFWREYEDFDIKIDLRKNDAVRFCMYEGQCAQNIDRRWQIHWSGKPSPAYKDDPHGMKAAREKLHDTQQDNQSFWLAECILLPCCLAFWPIIFIVLAVWFYSGYVKSKHEPRVRLFYLLNDGQRKSYEALQELLTRIFSSEKVLRIKKSGLSANYKYNAGASFTVDAERCQFSYRLPEPFQCNLNVPCIKDEDNRFTIFLPDGIVLYSYGDMKSIRYDEMYILNQEITFVEGDEPAGDAGQVSETWQYVNRDGSPDRRFYSNRKLPVMKYGKLCFLPNEGEYIGFVYSCVTALNSLSKWENWTDHVRLEAGMVPQEIDITLLCQGIVNPRLYLLLDSFYADENEIKAQIRTTAYHDGQQGETRIVSYHYYRVTRELVYGLGTRQELVCDVDD